MQQGIDECTCDGHRWEEGGGNVFGHKQRHRDSRNDPCGRRSQIDGYQSRG